MAVIFMEGRSRLPNLHSLSKVAITDQRLKRCACLLHEFKGTGGGFGIVAGVTVEIGRHLDEE